MEVGEGDSPGPGAVYDAVMEQIRAAPSIPPEVAELLANAAEREEVFAFGTRLVLARCAYPTRLQPFLALLEVTDFKSEDAVDGALAWILRHWNASAFPPTLRMLLARLEEEERASLFVRLAVPEGRLADVPGYVEALRRADGVDYSPLLARMDTPACASMLAWLAAEGNEGELLAEALRQRAAPSAASALVSDALVALARERLLGDRPERGLMTQLALVLLGAPAYAGHPDAASLAVQAAADCTEKSVRRSGVLSLAGQLERGWPALDAEQRRALIRCAVAPIWTDEERRTLALAGLPEALDPAARELFRAPEAAARLHRVLLRSPADLLGDGLSDELAAIYRRCAPVALAGLFDAIGPDSEPGYLPVWRALLTSIPPTPRKRLVDALARLGAPEVEAALGDVLRSDSDPAVVAAAVAATERLGTRSSLEPLAAAGDRLSAVRSATRTAAEAIRRRYPADALPDAGSVSLASTGERGAVSLATAAGPGALSHASEAAPGGAALPARADEETAADLWLHLGAPPRPVPLGAYWVSRTSDLGGGGVLVLLLGVPAAFLFAACMGLAPGSWLMAGEPSGGLMWAACAASWLIFLYGAVSAAREARDLRRFLREAVPTTARMVGREKREERAVRNRKMSTVVTYRYGFEVLCQDGQRREHTYVSTAPVKRLEDDHEERVLYLPGPDGAPTSVKLMDDLPHLQMDPQGRLRNRPAGVLTSAVMTLGLFGPGLLFLGAMAYEVIALYASF